MAISLAVSITRFHSLRVDVVKKRRRRVEDDGVGATGRSNSRSVNCKCLLIGIVKKASEEKITWANLPLLWINEELVFPFAALDGSREVCVLREVCLTMVSIKPQHFSQTSGRASFPTVTTTYLSHCHQTQNQVSKIPSLLDSFLYYVGAKWILETKNPPKKLVHTHVTALPLM